MHYEDSEWIESETSEFNIWNSYIMLPYIKIQDRKMIWRDQLTNTSKFIKSNKWHPSLLQIH